MLWQETPITNLSGAFPARHHRTTSCAGADSRPKCTPSARAASATSNRSLIIIRDWRSVSRTRSSAKRTIRRARSSSCPAGKSFSRSCTQSTRAARATCVLCTTPSMALASVPAADKDLRSVTEQTSGLLAAAFNNTSPATKRFEREHHIHDTQPGDCPAQKRILYKKSQRRVLVEKIVHIPYFGPGDQDEC